MEKRQLRGIERMAVQAVVVWSLISMVINAGAMVALVQEWDDRRSTFSIGTGSDGSNTLELATWLLGVVLWMLLARTAWLLSSRGPSIVETPDDPPFDPRLTSSYPPPG